MTSLCLVLLVDQRPELDLGDLDGAVTESERPAGRRQIVVEGWSVILRPSSLHADLLSKGMQLFVGTVGDHVAPEVAMAFANATRERGMLAVVVVACKEQWIDVHRHASSASGRHVQRLAAS